MLKTLLERCLIKQVGRRETVGRPILYATTDEFLNYFGLNELSELPELADMAAVAPEGVLELGEQADADPSAPDSEADLAEEGTQS